MCKRKSNLELLRIISMCGIIVMHYCGMGGAIHHNLFPSFSWLFTHVVNSLAIPCVNCFVLITGYFMIDKSSFSLRKIIELLIITVLYGGISYLIILYVGGNSITIKGVFESIFPFIIGKRWFVESYIILLLLIPFINKTLRDLERFQYRILLIIQLSIFSVWYSIGLSAPLLDDGYGVINFITLYMIGGYINHNKEDKFLNWKKEQYLGIYIISAVITFVFSYFINPYGYAFFTNIIGASALFIAFLKWNIGTKAIINKISASVFDVYFVHSDFNTSYLLFYEWLGAKYVVDSPKIMLHIIFVVMVVWIIGIISFIIRKFVFSISISRWLDNVVWINREIEI